MRDSPRDIFALRDILLLHITERILVPHFISRRAISGMKDPRLPQRFHRDEKIARARACRDQRRRNIPYSSVPHFNPFPSREERGHLLLRRTFRNRIWMIRTRRASDVPFSAPLLQAYKISRQKQAWRRTEGGEPLGSRLVRAIPV